MYDALIFVTGSVKTAMLSVGFSYEFSQQPTGIRGRSMISQGGGVLSLVEVGSWLIQLLI